MADMTPIDLITVSREVGAGGSDVARLLGERLGWSVLDRDMIPLVAARLSLDEGAVERMDEQPARWAHRLGEAMRMVVPPEAGVIPDIGIIPNPDAVANAARAVILEAAQRPPLIIVGHGAQCLFRDRPGTLHVRLVAPISARIQRLQGRFGWDATHAVAEAKRFDADRRAYTERHYKRDWSDPLLYDIQINTGRITIEQAVRMVQSLVTVS